MVARCLAAGVSSKGPVHPAATGIAAADSLTSSSGCSCIESSKQGPFSAAPPAALRWSLLYPTLLLMPAPLARWTACCGCQWHLCYLPVHIEAARMKSELLGSSNRVQHSNLLGQGCTMLHLICAAVQLHHIGSLPGHHLQAIGIE